MHVENAKQRVEEILTSLPEDSSLEDIQYHIYVRQKIEQGLADADAGRVLSHAQVEQRLAKWLNVNRSALAVAWLRSWPETLG